MSMQLDVASLREPRTRVDRTDAPSAFEPEESYRITSPVHLAFDVLKDKASVRLVGHLDTTLELGCARCLEGYPVPVAVPFDVRYLPAAEMPADEEREIEEEDLDVAYYREGQIDLAQLVREQLYLALPMKPLCREDCRGLCALCGTNLNTGSCACTPAWEDPRLAPLRALTRRNDDA